jgi:hypothetical protein
VAEREVADGQFLEQSKRELKSAKQILEFLEAA